jgi:hypothetical protein
MRIVLAGIAVGVMAVAAAAWFNEPPFAATLFYVGVAIVGIGVVAGTAGILVTGRWKGR